MSEPTKVDRKRAHLFQPGQSGNPAGKPKGSRNKLGEDFLKALHEDFVSNGVQAIKDVREAKPHEYLKVVASVVPKELHLKAGELDDLTDDQIRRQLAAGLAALAAAGLDLGAGTGPEAAPEPAGKLPTLQ